jgi:hypothetical protein
MPVFRVGANVAALLLLGAASAYAQTPGQICGTVTDPSGAGMPGVSVTLMARDAAPSRTATTDPKGDYLFPNVWIGTYTLSFELSGFKKAVRPGLVVKASLELRADQRLEPGTPTDQLEMKPFPPVVDVKKTGTTATSATATGQRPVPLPPCGAPR